MMFLVVSSVKKNLISCYCLVHFKQLFTPIPHLYSNQFMYNQIKEVPPNIMICESLKNLLFSFFNSMISTRTILFLNIYTEKSVTVFGPYSVEAFLLTDQLYCLSYNLYSLFIFAFWWTHKALWYTQHKIL